MNKRKERNMKKHRVKIFALIMVVLAIIAAIVYFEQREEVIEGSLRVTNGTKTVMLNPSKFEQTQVSGVRVNGKGEEIPVNGLGIAIKDVIAQAQIAEYAFVKVVSDDAYTAELSAEEVKDETKAFLLFDEENELRLVVFGDTNSKRSVSDVVEIVVE
jgi:hypothetical protein